jgi:molybdenum cofactor biosynthesis protein B
MSEAVLEHRQGAPQALNLAVMTVSDTRTLESDRSGALIVALSEAAGHRVIERVIIPDEPDRMRPLLLDWSARHELHAILVTGGTGISPRDQTFETVSSLLTKPLPGYGSRAAVELAMTKIILPELPHLVREARKR